MEKRLRKKGLVAILDGLAAYAIAFVCIGMLALLLSSGQEADAKTSRTLNLWAEDIADAVGMSMVDPNHYDNGWYSETSDAIKGDINQSLMNIARDTGAAIDVNIEGGWAFNTSDIGDARTVATARRLLMTFTINNMSTPDPSDDTFEPDGGVKLMTVKVGI